MAEVMSYELTIALESDMQAEKSKKIIEEIERETRDLGGVVEKTESLGIKLLSYPIRAAKQASFFRFFLHLPSDKIGGFQDDLAKNDKLLRVLLIKGGENGKKR